MKLRTKLTGALLLISLITSAMVGGTAHWLLMRDFRQSVLEQSFINFRTDVSAYIARYGSWEAATQAEPFPVFVVRSRRTSRLPPPGEQGSMRPDSVFNRNRTPPFRFLLLDPEGRVIKAGGQFGLGQTLPDALRRTARPITVHGKIEALAVPLGDPNLSPQDLSYLAAMRHALITGFLVAGTLALLLGWVFGRRMSAALDTLTTAIRTMRPDGELQQRIQVASRDEIGELATAINRMSGELSEAHHELRELSIRDPLTQLYNRRHFSEQAARLFEQATRYGRPLSIMVGDLDHFKAINDEHSHAVGDEVLQRVGKLMREKTRKSDILARHGGEEFVIAFAETSLHQAQQHCEALRRLIEEQPWHEIRDGLRVTLSMGISDNLALGSVEKMLNEADNRLYTAKQKGRNRIEPLAPLVDTQRQAPRAS